MTQTKNQQSRPVSAPAPTGKLHPRNRHQGRYDFARLIMADNRLENFVTQNAQGEASIDFSDPEAVKSLNRALLKDVYGIQAWDIPAQYLCPPVPGRADHLHYLADLLAGSNHGRIPKSRIVQILDIGTGANCIYPLLGQSEFGWRFVATDINPASLDNAQSVLDANPALKDQITLRLQASASAIFKGIILDGEWFDLTLCNPPFHPTLTGAEEGTRRKWLNLGRAEKVGETHSTLNFGGQGAELCYPGGEQAFIQRMIRESAQIPTRCFWFSSLVSKSDSLPSIYAELKLTKVREYKTIPMRQGQKESRLIAWTFLNPEQQAAWRKLRW